MFEGWDAAGKGSTLGRLLQPLDPRGFKVHVIHPDTHETVGRPHLWRFWVRIPARGSISLYERSWYRDAMDGYVHKEMTREEFTAAQERIRVFERQLMDDGTIVVKVFLHISREEQAERFKKLRKKADTAWRVGTSQRRQQKEYAAYAKAAGDLFTGTSTADAPWHIVSATDKRYTEVQVAKILVEAFEKALHRKPPAIKKAPTARVSKSGPLADADLSVSLSRKEYKEELPLLQEEARRLQHLCYLEQMPVVMVYEGWDAAGKGGSIRRLVRMMDPRGYEVVPVAAPAGDEKLHHYLWRFWRALPRAGHFAIFDRSWYGRVLVERVEGFATPLEWQRAYQEINEFESQIAESGSAIIKYWFHVSKDEQMRRFRERQADSDKHWKITDEDWRNRKKWDQYWVATSDMLEKTSTEYAPWTIIEGDDKAHARVKALRVMVKTVAEALEKHRRR